MGRQLPDGHSRGRSIPQAAMAGMGERAGRSWRRLAAIGIGDGRPRTASRLLLGPRVLQGNIEKVSIRWNTILTSAVQILGGPEPVYTHERANGLIQARVRFRVPLGKDGGVSEDVEAVGMRCYEKWEAESTAALSALGQLECGPFHIHILDISRLQYEEMQKSCYQHLLKAGEVCRGIKLLLADWEDTMVKTEDCYRGLYEEVVENACRGFNADYSEIACDVANCIHGLTRASYLKLGKLAAEAEETKASEWDVRSRVKHHFHDRCHHRLEAEQVYLPREMKLCMKNILDEMIKSLGWDEPMYKFKQQEADMYGCEVLLMVNFTELGAESKKPLIAVGEGMTQDEALETACQNAVLLLEREMSICVVDINYSRRSHAELYVSETCKVLNLANDISMNIISEWESLVDGLQAREKQCWAVVAQHSEKQPWNQLYNAKCECAQAIADLHGECLSDLVLAKDRHRLLSSWLDHQAQGR